MATLGRRDAKIAESGFHYYARAGDLVPLHWNSQPRIIRSPAAHANEQIRTVLAAEHPVESGDSLGYFLYDPTLRFLADVVAAEPERRAIGSSGDEPVWFTRFATARFMGPRSRIACTLTSEFV